MKKFLVVLAGILLLQTGAFAKDKIEFNFPNDGWHPVASPDGVPSKKCYVPYNQTSENNTEMLIFTQRGLKNADMSATGILNRQLGKDRNNFPDIVPENMKQEFDDAMITWCSKIKNTCAVERAFKGNQGIVLAIYMNKMPHYSNNMFGQWSNILSNIKVYDGTTPQGSIIDLN